MKNLKKVIAPIAMAAVMLATSALPASAVNNVRTFSTEVNSTYSMMTACYNFRRYVTANAQINNNNRIVARRSARGFRSAVVQVKRYCPSGSVSCYGWASNY